MRKISICIFVIIISFLYSACDGSGGGGGGDDGNYNEATSLGASLTLSSGSFVSWQFDISETSWTNPGNFATDNDFELTDESDSSVYTTDNNTAAGFVTVDINYSGTPNLYSSSGWTGISTSDSSVQITTVFIDASNGGGDPFVELAYCELVSGTPDVLEQYYYLYADGDVVLDGSYADGGDTHIYNNIKFFQGWNQIIRETSDGETFNYKTGTIDGGQWTLYVP